MSKNAEGWIRHRGGKCPVKVGVKVDYRMRNGSIDDFGRKSETLDWAHYSEIGDIMAYRLHKPAEQPYVRDERDIASDPDGILIVNPCDTLKAYKPAEQAVNMEALSATADAFGDSHADVMESVLSRLDGPLQWRDRITEIDATTQALTTERAELVQKLASEGFELIGRINDLLTDAAQKHEDMSDWRNWKVGDRLVITDSGLDDCVKGEMLTIDGLDFDDDNQPIGAQNDNGIHHWPIIKAGHFKTLTWHSRPSA